MPRQARLDAPDTLHHVMVRGLERRVIFRDDTDREDFVARLATLAAAGALTVYAWALLPNHAHLLVRTGTRPLPRSMRSLLTGYAGAFNRRHTRVGHLFQNRYKSIMGYGTLPRCARCGSLGSIMPRQPRLDAPDTLHHVTPCIYKPCV
jgi:putative transposase